MCIRDRRYTINIIVVLVLTFAMYAYLKYSKQGYEISAVSYTHLDVYKRQSDA